MLNEIPILEHADANSIAEAVELLRTFGNKAKIIAGGTDLLGLIKDNVHGPKMPIPELLVNISNIPELRVLSYEEGRGLRIGAASTLSNLVESEVVREKYPLLSQASSSIATLQIRNMGTVGGNLCQRPWCWYFRNNAFNCFKKGGKQCYAITGEHQYYFSVLGLGVCVMSHPSDLAPALIALDSEIEIASPAGLRKIPLEKFFLGPRNVFETILSSDEFIVGIDVPPAPKETKMAYLKNRVRDTWDFSLATAAVSLRISEGICVDSRIVLGGLAPFPYRSLEAEMRLKGNRIDEKVAAEAAREAVAKAKSLRMNSYKIKVGEVTAKEAILMALHNR